MHRTVDTACAIEQMGFDKGQGCEGFEQLHGQNERQHRAQANR